MLATETAPWGTSGAAQILTLGGGTRVVVHSGRGSERDRRALARRLRLGRALPFVAPWIPVPEIVAGDAAAPEPFVVTRFVAGDRGRDLLADDRGAEVLARAMGTLLPEFARAPIRGLRLSTAWGDPERLTVAARRWLADSEALLGADEEAAVGRLLDRVPAELGGAAPVFAHGDFAPVNVILRGGAVVAVLDLERGRLAHPLFDAAWWRWIVRYHHPQRWPAAGPAFFSSAGIELEPAEVARLDFLAALQCLEMVHLTPRREMAVRGEWAARLRAVLAWR